VPGNREIGCKSRQNYTQSIIAWITPNLNRNRKQLISLILFISQLQEQTVSQRASLLHPTPEDL
jgi:hypothetical protein